MEGCSQPGLAALRDLPVAQATLGAAMAVLATRANRREHCAWLSAAVRGAVLARGEQQEAEGAEKGALAALESALELTGELAGASQRLSPAQAKHELRARGAEQAAAKLGRLAKQRNLEGHPDTGLEEKILRAFDGRSEGPGGAGSTDQESAVTPETPPAARGAAATAPHRSPAGWCGGQEAGGVVRASLGEPGRGGPGE